MPCYAFRDPSEWNDLLDLNLADVIPAVGLPALDRQLDGWLPRTRVKKTYPQPILSRLDAIGYIER
jgi:hypothetical protein